MSAAAPTKQQALLDRPLPECVDAERTLLGSILLDNSVWADCTDLGSHEFGLPTHRQIYAAMCDLANQGKPVDQIMLLEHLRKSNALNAAGGISYIVSLTDRVPRRASVEHYVRLVRDKAALRSLIQTADAIAQRACTAIEPADEVIASAEQELIALQSIFTESGKGETTIAQDVMATLDRIHYEARQDEQLLLGMSLDLPALDACTLGLKEGELVVIGALPERAKTAFAMQVARVNALRGDRVDFWTLEMSRDMIYKRSLASASWRFIENNGMGLFPSKLRDPRNLKGYDMTLLERSAEWHAQLPLKLHKPTSYTCDKIIAQARLAVRKHKSKLLIFDTLKKLAFASPGKSEYERHNYAIQAIAKLVSDEGVVGIVLHHLSNPPEKDINKRPNMMWLKESGDIPGAASVVLLLHRYVDTEKDEFTGLDEIIVGKMRDGEHGPVPVVFNKKTLEYEPRDPSKR